MRRSGTLGIIASGAAADLLVVDGDPLEDLKLLTNQGKHIPQIMKGGVFAKNHL